MGDLGDTFRDWKAYNRAIRFEYGIPCEQCLKSRPLGNAKILLPSQKCGYGHRDPRQRLSEDEKAAAARKHQAPVFEREE
jgi:hypothetical protein